MFLKHHAVVPPECTLLLLVHHTSVELGRDQQVQASFFYCLLSGKCQHFAPGFWAEDPPAPCGACCLRPIPSPVCAAGRLPASSCLRLPAGSRCIADASATFVAVQGRRVAGSARCSGRHLLLISWLLAVHFLVRFLIQQLSTVLSVIENRLLAEGPNSCLEPSARTQTRITPGFGCEQMLN